MITNFQYNTFKPSTYEDAWKTIKRVEQLSTAQAMRQAQDQYPKLYQAFLANCPRGRA